MYIDLISSGRVFHIHNIVPTEKEFGMTRLIGSWRWARAIVVFCGVALVGQAAVSQHFRHPQPGDIYKEYSRTMMEYYEWRVTDPNASSIWIPDPSYLSNTVLPITISDLSGATRAELVIDLWQGHAGTTGKKFRVNGNDWIYIPELTTPPGDGQCWHSQSNVIVDVPLWQLQQGTNYLQGSNEGQTCHSFDWGQHGWNGVIFRIYYNSSKPHPTGSITSPTAGSSFGELPTITASASGGAGIARVDFIAYYDGLDTDGDGVYQDWHYYYHRLKSEFSMELKGHVGTAWGSPWQVVWDTDLVPDQSPGSIKMIARIQDNNGVWFVTDAVENLTLSRTGSYVRLYKSYGIPSNFYVRAFGELSSYFDISWDHNLDESVSRKLVLSTWNGISGGKQPSDDYFFKVNGWRLPQLGENHFWLLDYIDIPRSSLNNGENTFTIYSESMSTGLTIHWPGPQLVVRYGGEPVPVQLASFSAKVVSSSSVRLEWTTLSETNNYGFEVEKSQQASGPFTMIPNSFVQGHGTTVVQQDYTFTDETASTGRWYYRLKQIDLDGTFTYTDPVVADVLTSVGEQMVPTEAMLAQNYPNPFNPSTNIRYGLPERAFVTLTVVNTLGQPVATLVNEEVGPGYHDVRFNAEGLAAGVYFYRLTAGSFVETRKLLLLK